MLSSSSPSPKLSFLASARMKPMYWLIRLSAASESSLAASTHSIMSCFVETIFIPHKSARRSVFKAGAWVFTRISQSAGFYIKST